MTNAAKRREITNDIDAICFELNIPHRWITEFQVRLNEHVDIYLKAQRFHCITNNTRGNTGYIADFIKRKRDQIKARKTI